MADKKFKYEEFQYDDFKQNPYQESDTVKQAQATLNEHLAQKPGAYQSQWQTQLNDTMNKIMNREKFSYDLNGDALYQQFKDKFIQQGKMASADVMGQAAAMTGGYGNSYAATVGNQAYQASLQNLNDIVPELYQMALDRYNQEGQELLNQYGILGDRENTDYGRYRDTVSDYNTERNYLSGRYDSERNYDYGKYSDDRNFNYGKYSDDKSYAYNEHRNAIADEQWQKQFDEAMRQYNENMAFQKQQYDDSKLYAGGSSGGNSSNNSSNAPISNPQNNNNNTASGVPDNIRKKAETFTNNDALNEYLTKQKDLGLIDEKTMGELYLEYEIPTLQKRDWKAGSDGGTNWFGGIDNNATVKDQYGNEYRLDKLVNALVAEGMDKASAKEYAKKLQSKLGL
jgi:hypothetical protein